MQLRRRLVFAGIMCVAALYIRTTIVQMIVEDAEAQETLDWLRAKGKGRGRSDPRKLSGACIGRTTLAG